MVAAQFGTVATQFGTVATAAEGCDALVATGVMQVAARSVTENLERAVRRGAGTHRASIDLPPVDNVRDHIFTDHPWLAADPTPGPWQEPMDRGVVRTGA